MEALQMCIWLNWCIMNLYKILREELLKSGAVISKYDQAILTWYFGNKLHRIIATHVNDFCFARSEIFQTRVMDRLRHLFKIKSAEAAEFQYIGLNIKNMNNVILGHNEYKTNLNVSQ